MTTITLITSNNCNNQHHNLWSTFISLKSEKRYVHSWRNVVLVAVTLLNYCEGSRSWMCFCHLGLIELYFLFVAPLFCTGQQSFAPTGCGPHRFPNYNCSFWLSSDWARSEGLRCSCPPSPPPPLLLQLMSDALSFPLLQIYCLAHFIPMAAFLHIKKQ